MLNGKGLRKSVFWYGFMDTKNRFLKILLQRGVHFHGRRFYQIPQKLPFSQPRDCHNIVMAGVSEMTNDDDKRQFMVKTV